MKEHFRSGELARAAGVSTDTLRHYERKGVLPAPRRAENGYRQYPSDALARVRMVRGALAIGFTLDELARLLKTRNRGGAPCREVRALAGRKLSEVEARLSELAALRERLREVLAGWDTRLASSAEGERASLLETLLSAATAGGKPARRGRPRPPQSKLS